MFDELTDDQLRKKDERIEDQIELLGEEREQISEELRRRRGCDCFLLRIPCNGHGR